MSVIVPLDVPFTSTLTPINGSPCASATVPLAVIGVLSFFSFCGFLVESTICLFTIEKLIFVPLNNIFITLLKDSLETLIDTMRFMSTSPILYTTDIEVCFSISVKTELRGTFDMLSVTVRSCP